MSLFSPLHIRSLLLCAASLSLLCAANGQDTGRQMQLLNGQGWQFVGAGDAEALPDITTPAFNSASWTNVTVPHIFQTRAAYDTLTKGWYRRQVTVDPSQQGRELYLIFEGAASIADVYVNGKHLGQHRGAYTRFIFDATSALHPGANELDVLVDDTPANTLDCLPISKTGLYKVWGGLYRNVWLVSTADVHIDPTDEASPGVYITPTNVSENSANLKIRVLLRNTSSSVAQAEVRAKIIAPNGTAAGTLNTPAAIPANGRSAVDLTTVISHPTLWAPRDGKLYRVETSVYVNGLPVDEVTQNTGFRWLKWDWTGGTVMINGKRVILYGVDLHQETEIKGSAVSPDDLKANFEVMKDLGNNFVRLPHYPHAAIEYDLCDQDGLLCWCENGNSNGKDIASPTAAQITTEMVKQNYNHPSIVIWSMGNEAAAAPADECVPLVKALDQTRPVGVANMKSSLADIHTRHCYFGWYAPHLSGFRPQGFMTEVGIGGVVTVHCDYNKADWSVNKYEPEEYQQIGAEYHFQKAFHDDDSHLGLFCWWILRDFSDAKYKGPVGWNSKGLETYAASKKDVYYLYRSFLRPNDPTLWITSKRYFLRQGAVDNGIKVYSNARTVTLTVNGQNLPPLTNGQYVIPNGPWSLHAGKKKGSGHDGASPSPAQPSATPEPYVPVKVDNVFYWPVPLHTGRNTVTATDDHGHTDSAVVYFYGANGLPELPQSQAPIAGLVSSNPKNVAYYMDEPVHAQWPLYYDLDSTADNSWNTLPPELDGATWIALRRVTKPGQATNLSFTLTRPARVCVVATNSGSAPAFAGSGGFQEVANNSMIWRDNSLLLVPAQLYVHNAVAGEKINLPLGDRDAVVLIK